MRSQLATGFLARNPNPTPASHKAGDLQGSAASMAHEGFRDGFGSESAQVSPVFCPVAPAPALLSVTSDVPQLRPPLQLPGDTSFEKSPEINPRGVFSTGKWKCSSNIALRVPCELSSCSCSPAQQMERRYELCLQNRSRRAAMGKGDKDTHRQGHRAANQLIPFYCFQ